MKFDARVTLKATLRFPVEADYAGQAEHAAEYAVRQALEAHFPRSGVAFEPTEVHADYGEDGE